MMGKKSLIIQINPIPVTTVNQTSIFSSESAARVYSIHYNIYFKIKQADGMKKDHKEGKDEDFTPKDIRKRASYRKISQDIKNYMAKLYYVEHVKMSRLVKKYNISFSTITDILKKYDSNGERLRTQDKPKSTPATKETCESDRKCQVKNDIKIEYIYPLVQLEMESPHNPEYVFYDN